MSPLTQSFGVASSKTLLWYFTNCLPVEAELLRVKQVHQLTEERHDDRTSPDHIARPTLSSLIFEEGPASDALATSVRKERARLISCTGVEGASHSIMDACTGKQLVNS